MERVDADDRCKRDDEEEPVDWIDDAGLSLELADEQCEQRRVSIGSTQEERRLDRRAEGCRWDDTRQKKAGAWQLAEEKNNCCWGDNKLKNRRQDRSVTVDWIDKQEEEDGDTVGKEVR